MANSDAVIGIPANGTVARYELYNRGADLLSEERQTLMDTALEVNDEGTVMTFARKLVEDDGLGVAIVEGEINTFLHAMGGEALGYHSSRSAFQVDIGPFTEG